MMKQENGILAYRKQVNKLGQWSDTFLRLPINWIFPYNNAISPWKVSLYSFNKRKTTSKKEESHQLENLPNKTWNDNKIRLLLTYLISNTAYNSINISHLSHGVNINIKLYSPFKTDQNKDVKPIVRLNKLETILDKVDPSLSGNYADLNKEDNVGVILHKSGLFAEKEVSNEVSRLYLETRSGKTPKRNVLSFRFFNDLYLTSTSFSKNSNNDSAILSIMNGSLFSLLEYYLSGLYQKQVYISLTYLSQSYNQSDIISENLGIYFLKKKLSQIKRGTASRRLLMSGNRLQESILSACWGSAIPSRETYDLENYGLENQNEYYGEKAKSHPNIYESVRFDSYSVGLFNKEKGKGHDTQKTSKHNLAIRYSNRRPICENLESQISRQTNQALSTLSRRRNFEGVEGGGSYHIFEKVDNKVKSKVLSLTQNVISKYLYMNEIKGIIIILKGRSSARKMQTRSQTSLTRKGTMKPQTYVNIFKPSGTIMSDNTITRSSEKKKLKSYNRLNHRLYNLDNTKTITINNNGILSVKVILSMGSSVHNQRLSVL